MTRAQLKAEKASEVLRAFEEGKPIEWRSRNSVAWVPATVYGCSGDDLQFDFQKHEYRIAKERQSLGHIQEGGTYGDSHEVSIDSDGLHVGCTTISFERVREIAKACREWQNGSEPKRATAHVAVRKTDGRLGWVQKDPIESLHEREWRDVLMREVLPGEEEI